MALEALFEARAVRDPGWNRWANGDDFTPANGKRTVGTREALDLLPVFGSISFIADLVAQLPVDHYRKTGTARAEVVPRAGFLDRPNPELNGQDYRTQFVAALLTSGMNYDVVLRDSLGQVRELWPQHPDCVRPYRDRPGTPIEWYIDGSPFYGELRYTRGFSVPGQFLGLSPIAHARHSIASGIAAQEYGEAFYDNGSIPSVAISVPGGPDSVDATALSRSFERVHKGAGNAHKVAVVTGGATITPLTISPADAQWLEGQNYSDVQIATKLFRIPPELAGAAIIGGSSVTYQNIEQRWTELVRRCFMTWITKYEQAMFGLLPGKAQYVRVNTDAYLRADLQTRYNSYGVAITNRFMTPNEARAFEDLPPLDGGDSFPTEPSAPAPIPGA